MKYPYRLLMLLAALAPPYYVVMGVIATLTQPGYSSVSQTMSQLGATTAAQPWIISSAFIGYAVLVQALGPLLQREVGYGKQGRFLWLLVLVYGAGGALAAFFPVGGNGIVLYQIDQDMAHSIGARLSFAGILSLCVITPVLLRNRKDWQQWRLFSYAVFVATLLLVVPFELDAWEGKRGVLQRGFFVTTMAWVLVTALTFRRATSKRD